MGKMTIDKEIRAISAFLKKEMNIYKARGISFKISVGEGEDKGFVLSKNLIDKTLNENGLLPIFTNDINNTYIASTGAVDNLPFVYSKQESAIVSLSVELSENVNLKNQAFLTTALSMLDYNLETRVKKAYEEKYGSEGLDKFLEKRPISVDISDMYTDFMEKMNKNELVIYAEPKVERVVAAPKPARQRVSSPSSKVK